MQLYDFTLSGHCHRVRLMLSILNLDYMTIPVNLAATEHKRDEYKARNPFGQVPTLVDGEVTLYDSNAILVYLARRYGAGDWLPDDPLEQAHMQEWLAKSSCDLAAGPATVRAIALFGNKSALEPAVLRAYNYFDALQRHLDGQDWLIGAGPTIADIANYTYTAHAPEGGLDLGPYDRIHGWLARVEALPGFVAMPASPKAARIPDPR